MVVKNPLGQNGGWTGTLVYPKFPHENIDSKFSPWLAAWWHGLLSRLPVLVQRPRESSLNGHKDNTSAWFLCDILVRENPWKKIERGYNVYII